MSMLYLAGTLAEESLRIPSDWLGLLCHLFFQFGFFSVESPLSHHLH
jgi:hypothetical protein